MIPVRDALCIARISLQKKILRIGSNSTSTCFNNSHRMFISDHRNTSVSNMCIGTVNEIGSENYTERFKNYEKNVVNLSNYFSLKFYS